MDASCAALISLSVVASFVFLSAIAELICNSEQRWASSQSENLEWFRDRRSSRSSTGIDWVEPSGTIVNFCNVNNTKLILSYHDHQFQEYKELHKTVIYIWKIVTLIFVKFIFYY
jgi:hypothetical protein